MAHDAESHLDLAPPGADAEERDLIARALALARRVHADQIRKDGSTVLDHVLAVTRNVLEAGVDDPEVIAAALLHDVVENSPAPLAEIEEGFGRRVALLVGALTNRPSEGPEAPLACARAAGPAALLLRLCDRLDGVRRAAGRPPRSRARFLAETRERYLAVAEEAFPALAAALREAVARAEDDGP
jgi:(p)ppGpp synthase/HD superfamily hydrolase